MKLIKIKSYMKFLLRQFPKFQQKSLKKNKKCRKVQIAINWALIITLTVDKKIFFLKFSLS